MATRLNTPKAAPAKPSLQKTLAKPRGKKIATLKAPDYWQQACDDLMRQDRILRKLIPRYGTGFLVTRGDAFNTLARAIVGQQISVAAAQSVWNRLVANLEKK